MHLPTFSLGLLATAAQTAVLNRRAVLEDCLSQNSTGFDEVGSADWLVDSAPYNERLPYTPVAIAVPTSLAQIQSAVLCGSQMGYKVTPKSGGHSYASFGLGGEDGHLIIQLDRMFNVKLNTETNIATAEPGTRLGHLAAELYAQGKRAISHGTCPGVGISGHILHGGFGMSSHTRGLALDWVDGMTVVLANGTAVHTSATENPEIHWGMLGAGSNFGVVASYELRTFEPPENVTWFIANIPWRENNSVSNLEALEDYAMNTMPAELNMRVYATSRMTQLEGSYQGNKAQLQEALAPLLNVTGGTIAQAQTTNWIGGLEHFANMKLNQTRPHKESANFYSKSVELKTMKGKPAQQFVDYWYSVAKSQTMFWYFQMDLQGGKNSAVWNADPNLTSYAHRDKLYILQFYARAASSGPVPKEAFKFVNDWATATTGPMAPEDWGMYINYPDTTLNRTTAQTMYWGQSVPRLQKLKGELDPHELFYYPVSVEPVIRE